MRCLTAKLLTFPPKLIGRPVRRALPCVNMGLRLKRGAMSQQRQAPPQGEGSRQERGLSRKKSDEKCVKFDIMLSSKIG
jgi:hypothetical protein